MAVIIIDGKKVDSTIIEQLAFSLNLEVSAIINVLRRFLQYGFNTQVIYDFPLQEIEPLEFPVTYWDGDITSYTPRWGVFCRFLWINPSIIHDQLSVISGHLQTFFSRKCFMRLKTYSNLRFA